MSVTGGHPPGRVPAGLQPTVVHLGPGVFHRAHQAVYADTMLRSGSRTGAIWAVSMRSPAVRDALAGQGFGYHVVERELPASPDRPGPEETVRVHRVDSLLGITVAAQDVEAALARLTDPAVTVVTITVTENGYCADGPGGPLDLTRTEIRHDLSHPHAPRSVPGLLLEALARRRVAGLPPATIASCDNLPGNGAATRRVVTELADLRDGALAEWVRREVAFPSSMVDRMVPATTDADRDLVRGRTGLADAWPVSTEPFSQWVLQDTFPTGRPAWERAGVELVQDVAPFEQAKLRILNAAHSALAYWGLLAGHREIWQSAADPPLAATVRDLLEGEVLPTLATPPGWDLLAYVDQTLARFRNRSLPYTTAKVASDGSQKLPVRVLPTVSARVAAGTGTDRLALVVAGWVGCMLGPRSAGLAVADPALTRMLGGAPSPTADPEAAVDRALGLSAVFGPDLVGPQAVAGAAEFRATVRRHARAIWRDDLRALLGAGPGGPDPAEGGRG